MLNQIFKSGGGAGLGSYVIVVKNNILSPETKFFKVREAYETGETMYFSIINADTKAALLPAEGYIDPDNVLHLIGRDFDDQKTYFLKLTEDHSVDFEIKNGIDGVECGAMWEAGTGENSIQSKSTGCVAEGKYSVAEGWTSKTLKKDSDPLSGQAAHAEGAETNASGFAAHSEGGRTSAGGDHAHAEGYETTALGSDSHAEGNHTITNNFAEHAEGKFNVSHADSDMTDGNGTITSVGVGTAEVDPETGEFIGRKNGVEVMKNGDIYIIGIGGYDGTNVDTAQTVQDVIRNGGATSISLKESSFIMDGAYHTVEKDSETGIEITKLFNTPNVTRINSMMVMQYLNTNDTLLEVIYGTALHNQQKEISYLYQVVLSIEVVNNKYRYTAELTTD